MKFFTFFVLVVFARTIAASHFSIAPLNHTCTLSKNSLDTSTNGEDRIVHSLPEFLPYNKPGTTQRDSISECTTYIRIITDSQSRIILNPIGTNVTAWAKITDKESLSIATTYKWVEGTGFDAIGGGTFVTQGPIEGRISKDYMGADESGYAATATSYCGGGLLQANWRVKVTTSENEPEVPPEDDVDQSWVFGHSVGFAACNEAMT